MVSPEKVDNPFPLQCYRCRAPKVMEDALGMTWCENHAYRGNLINWLARHGWTGLQCPPGHPYPAYSIGPDAYCAAMAVILGTDDFIGLAVATTEMLDEQEVA